MRENRSEQTLCPVKAFELYCEQFKHPKGPLFRKLRWCKFQSSRLGINKIGEVPREIAQRIKLDDLDAYPEHSFRTGSASGMAEHGKKVLEAQKHLGHKHPNMSIRYIQESKRQKLSNAQSFVANRKAPLPEEPIPKSNLENVKQISENVTRVPEKVKREDASRFVLTNCTSTDAATFQLPPTTYHLPPTTYHDHANSLL